MNTQNDFWQTVKPTTRIGLIRQHVEAHGGKRIHPGEYFADGPNSDFASSRQKNNDEVRYKIQFDGLTDENRQIVANELNEHFMVKEAKLSRSGYLTVFFDGVLR